MVRKLSLLLLGFGGRGFLGGHVGGRGFGGGVGSSVGRHGGGVGRGVGSGVGSGGVGGSGVPVLVKPVRLEELARAVEHVVRASE